MQTIEQTIEGLRAMVAHADSVAPSVSGWTVGMHVHHCCLSMIGISKTLRRSTPPRPRGRPSLQRSCVLKLGFIPRGRSQSPSFVVPKAGMDPAELTALLDEASKQLAGVSSLDRGTWFSHPLLGLMGRDDAMRFVFVHNRHHLRIVADIVRATRS